MWDEEFKLLDRSYFLANIQDYFEHIVKKQKTFTDKLLVEIYVNSIQNRVKFKIKL